MKIFSFLTCLLLLLALSAPATALAAFPVMPNPMEARLKRYSEQAEKAEEKCRANKGAGVDTKAGQEYKSACMAGYKGAKKAADDYFAAEKAATAQINKLSAMSSNMCGANRTPAAQKECFESSAKNYEEVAKIKSEMADKLLASYNEAQNWRKLTAAALDKYRHDQGEIVKAEAEAASRATTLRTQGDNMAAAITIQQVQTAQAVNTSGISVAARDGNATTLSDYKYKLSELTQEQQKSAEYTAQFAEDAKNEASRLKTQSMNFEEMAAKARASAASIPTATDPNDSGISKDTKSPPIPRDGAAARAEYQAKQQAAAGGGTSGVGAKGSTAATTSADSSSYNGGATQDQSSTPTSQTPASTSTTPSAAAPAAAAMGGGAMAAPASSGVQPGGSNMAMNSPAAYGGGASAAQEQAAQDKLSGSNFNEVLGTHDPRAKSEENEQTAAADPETKVEEGSPEQVAAAGGLSGDLGGESSGASSSPGIRGADGKPIRTGFSSASGGDLHSSRRNMDRDAASTREQFSPDLKSGAVSIAGSEMKSAMQSLVQELGATDLDLDLGGLTEEEKAALAPLEGGDGVRNLAPIKNGRRTASVIQGSDASIQDEGSAALFTRTRSAHERAIRRGNLILGTKKKL